LDEILDSHNETLAVIRYHTWWPNGNDMYYRANVSENNARINYYGADYTPHLWIDGNVDGGSTYAFWENQISNEENVSSPLSIDLSADYGDEGDFGTITAVIAATDPITNTNLRTRIAITESNLPPFGQFDVFNCVMRDMVTDATGLALTIAEGDTVTQEANFTLSNDWNFANLEIVAFVQSDAGKRVLQAAKLIPPSGALTGQVTSSGSGFPVPNASVTILNTSYGDTTDSQGEYVFSFLPGNRTVVAGAPGYVPDTLSILNVPDDTTTLDIALEPGATSSITGTVTDPTTSSPILAGVTLFLNGDSLATVETDPLTGVYAFNGINVTSEPWVVYTDLRVVPSIPYPTVDYGNAILVEEGAPTVIDFEISPANVFLVDDDGGDGYEEYYKDEIASTGRTYYHYDVQETGEPAVNYLDLFPPSSVVVWFTGNAATNTLSEAEQDSLARFLDNGGKLFLTGQNIAEDLHLSGSTFLEDYLHVSYDSYVTYFIGRGVYGNPVTGYLDYFLTSGGGGANNQTSRDRLIATAPAAEFIYYIANPGDVTPRGTAAVYVEGGNASKAILMGFGFEAITRTGGDTTRATREETMLAILNWFDGITGIGDGPDAGGRLPKALALHQNYPNPFNPSTTIRYEIPVKGEENGQGAATMPVELALFDIRGRLIRQLVDRSQGPGTYQVHWDGRDDRSRPAGSGVYLYRLKTGDQVLTRKMLLMR